MHSPRLHLVLPVVLLAAACRGTTEPSAERAAELLEAHVPAAVSPGVAFEVRAYYGRGVCDGTRAVVERDPASLVIGMRVWPEPVPPGAACEAALVRDSVFVTVSPPFTLPYAVWLGRDRGADSLVVIQAR